MKEPKFLQHRAHLEALEGAGEVGFAPLGWLYKSVMNDLVEKGLAMPTAPGGAYVLSREGKEELQLQRSISK